MRLITTFRRALLPAVVTAAALLSGVQSAEAQSVTANYAPSCGPSTGCTTVRFQITNSTTSSMLFNTMTFTGNSSPFRFAPAAGGVALYQAMDSFGPFGGSGTVNVGGSQLLINFLGGNGFAFELGGKASGYVEAALTQTAPLTAGAFLYSATLQGGGTVTGTAVITPEPSTVVLLSAGLLLIGLGSRKRRRS